MTKNDKKNSQPAAHREAAALMAMILGAALNPGTPWRD